MNPELARTIWNTAFMVIIFLLWVWMRRRFNRLEERLQ